MAYANDPEKRWQVSKTYVMKAEDGATVQFTTSPDELSVVMTVCSPSGTQSSVLLNYEEWKALHALEYSIRIKKPEEKVMEVMEQGS